MGFRGDADFGDDSGCGDGACFAGRAAALVEFGDGQLACKSVEVSKNYTVLMQ